MTLPKPWQVPKSLNHHYKLCHNVIIENTTILKIVLDGVRISERGSSCTFFSFVKKLLTNCRLGFNKQEGLKIADLPNFEFPDPSLMSSFTKKIPDEWCLYGFLTKRGIYTAGLLYGRKVMEDRKKPRGKLCL